MEAGHGDFTSKWSKRGREVWEGNGSCLLLLFGVGIGFFSPFFMWIEKLTPILFKIFEL